MNHKITQYANVEQRLMSPEKILYVSATGLGNRLCPGNRFKLTSGNHVNQQKLFVVHATMCTTLPGSAVGDHPDCHGNHFGPL